MITNRAKPPFSLPAGLTNQESPLTEAHFYPVHVLHFLPLILSHSDSE